MCTSQYFGDAMGKNPAGYDAEYAKKNLKRIPLNVRKEKYEEIKTAADTAGESVNGYIKTAIDMRMSQEKTSFPSS